MPEMNPSLNELVQAHTRAGCPSIAQLAAAQGVSFPRDPRELLGDFWPPDESADDFLAALHEWRGHAKTDPAA